MEVKKKRGDVSAPARGIWLPHRYVGKSGLGKVSLGRAREAQCAVWSVSTIALTGQKADGVHRNACTKPDQASKRGGEDWSCGPRSHKLDRAWGPAVAEDTHTGEKRRHNPEPNSRVLPKKFRVRY